MKTHTLLKDEILLSRKTLATRWAVHPETIKRIEKRGKLNALQLGGQVRYRLSEVIQHEAQSERTTHSHNNQPNSL